tara:strand:- start:1024 stop:1722 length:699 start_codon:yes stop_codon:yes gene_type:complete
MPDQKIYAFICTRSKQLTDITQKYLQYLALSSIEVKLIVGQSSIFEGYLKAFKKTKPNPDDIIILSHDDIQIRLPLPSLREVLIKNITKGTGFVGPAGTTYLGKDSVWWNQERWGQGYHKGEVFHVTKETQKLDRTVYGPNGQVVVLDGLFLAAKAKVLEEIGLEKPDYLEGEWDFYDIHYTHSAHQKGYINKTVPLSIIHHSRGELAGRDSWHRNRELFIKKNEKEFPITC